MNKTERAELRGIVRNQFRVLKEEVIQRQQELLAQADLEIAEKTAEDTAKRENVQFLANQLVLECNRALNNLLYENGLAERRDTERMWLQSPNLYWDKQQYRSTKPEDMLQHAARADLQAKVTAAMTAMARQEADLLKELAIGALESDDARGFLARIPTVGELVPAARLAELERSVGLE